MSYIILPVERDVFLKLTKDRDRDIFIEAFWKQRDPTPATPQNEFKDEHIRRFNYANPFYRQGDAREGWMTDMGRIYIILGEPRSKERFEGVAGIHPCQVWYYYGEPAERLPTYFGARFLSARRLGRVQALQPGSDGPPASSSTRKASTSPITKLYEKIKGLAPTLARIAFSIVPGTVSLQLYSLPSEQLHPGRHLRLAQEKHQSRLRHPFSRLQDYCQHRVHDQFRREQRLPGPGRGPFSRIASFTFPSRPRRCRSISMNPKINISAT